SFPLLRQPMGVSAVSPDLLADLAALDALVAFVDGPHPRHLSTPERAELDRLDAAAGEAIQRWGLQDYLLDTDKPGPSYGYYGRTRVPCYARAAAGVPLHPTSSWRRMLALIRGQMVRGAPALATLPQALPGEKAADHHIQRARGPDPEVED